MVASTLLLKRCPISLKPLDRIADLIYKNTTQLRVRHSQTGLHHVAKDQIWRIEEAALRPYSSDRPVITQRVRCCSSARTPGTPNCPLTASMVRAPLSWALIADAVAAPPPPMIKTSVSKDFITCQPAQGRTALRLVDSGGDLKGQWNRAALAAPGS